MPRNLTLLMIMKELRKLLIIILYAGSGFLSAEQDNLDFGVDLQSCSEICSVFMNEGKSEIEWLKGKIDNDAFIKILSEEGIKLPESGGMIFLRWKNDRYIKDGYPNKVISNYINIRIVKYDNGLMVIHNGLHKYSDFKRILKLQIDRDNALGLAPNN